MNLLDRYLCAQFAKNIILVLGALVSIYLLVDFFERIDNFLEAGKSVGLAMRYFLLKIPFMFDMLQPVSVLLTGVITLGLVNHGNELLALNAGGVSLTRVAAPLLATALACTLAGLALAQWVLPRTQTVTNTIWNEEVSHKIPKGILRKGRYFHKGREGIYNFIRKGAADALSSFSYTRLGPDYEPLFMLTAQRAVWRDGAWTFYNGQIKRPAGKGRFTSEAFERKTLALPETPDEFFSQAYQPGEMSITALVRAVRDNDTRGGTINPAVELHGRLSFIFLGMPLIFLGLPVLLVVHRKWGHDLTVAVPLSCALAFAAWGWWSTAMSMARANYLSPALAAWSMHLVITPVGWWMLRRLDK